MTVFVEIIAWSLAGIFLQLKSSGDELEYRQRTVKGM